MSRMCRRQFTAAERTILWTRWRQGEPPSAIARALERHRSSVFAVVSARGGVPPRTRHRSGRVLSLAEREEVSRALAAGATQGAIAAHLGRAPSTISREIRRHGGRAAYRAGPADAVAWDRARRPKPCRLAQVPALRGVVAEKLALYWSPAQIAGWLKATYPDRPAMQVSHETIYLSLFVQSRGVLKRELIRHLRHRTTTRRAKTARHAGQGRGRIADAVSIRERPASVEDRAIPGHWEGDLLAGRRQSYIATLVERRSRYVLLLRVANRETATVVRALTRRARTLPHGLMATLTWDRGNELAAHRAFTVATNVKVYFCDPYSPWQRGSNENTNGLLRQYFPKGTDLSHYTQAQLNAVARQLNTRPRKTLGFRTPADMLNSIIASTA
jgi:IS30 family transposase